MIGGAELVAQQFGHGAHVGEGIGPGHIQKALIIFPKLLELLIPVLEENPYQRAVVVVCGGSGVGKSETASLISYYLNLYTGITWKGV